MPIPKVESENFAVFILTHGRANDVRTLTALKSVNFSGKIYLVVDDKDQQLEQYREIYGDSVVAFSKEDEAKYCDTMDNFHDMRIVLYARNACWNLAEQLGLQYFLVLDDDYNGFFFRRDGSSNYCNKRIKEIDPVLNLLLAFYATAPIASLAIAQGGDFIGGKDNPIFSATFTRRKAMNFFICSTCRPFKFFGSINEDVNAYLHHGKVGKIFMTVPNVSLNQLTTQQNSGGLTDIYLDRGTYIKSFYSVMIAPSCTKVGIIKDTFARLHHNITWNNAVPRIISESHRKIANA